MYIFFSKSSLLKKLNYITLGLGRGSRWKSEYLRKQVELAFLNENIVFSGETR